MMGNEYTGDLTALQAIGVKNLKIRPDENWVDGVLDRHFFQMKVFAESSEEYGIAKGRISKLVVCTGNKWNHATVVAAYDRGWERGSGYLNSRHPIVRRVVKALKETSG